MRRVYSGRTVPGTPRRKCRGSVARPCTSEVSRTSRREFDSFRTKPGDIYTVFGQNRSNQCRKRAVFGQGCPSPLQKTHVLQQASSASRATARTSAGLKCAPSGKPHRKNNASKVIDLQGIAGHHGYRSGLFAFDQTEGNQASTIPNVRVSSGHCGRTSICARNHGWTILWTGVASISRDGISPKTP